MFLSLFCDIISLLFTSNNLLFIQEIYLKSAFVKSLVILLLLLCSSRVYASSQTPEEACSAFMEALLASDRVALEKIIIPNENAFLLWDDIFFEGDDDYKNILSDFSYYSLSLGDRVALDDKTDFVVLEDMVGDDKAVVLVTLEGEPLSIPFFIRKLKDVWKVDASDIIDSRHILYLQAMSDINNQ